MANFLKQFNQILVTAMGLLLFIPVYAQVARHPAMIKKPVPSKQLKEFYSLTASAGATFIFPKGFKEIKAPDNEVFSFDYAMELPGKGFEIWFQVKSEKENWASFSKNPQLANPDSTYSTIGTATAIAFSGNQEYFARDIPHDILAPYHADAGKSYLLTLLDLPESKHYKYALLITLQKNHTGTLLAICFSNQKGPEFYQDIDKANNCLKFKP